MCQCVSVVAFPNSIQTTEKFVNCNDARHFFRGSIHHCNFIFRISSMYICLAWWCSQSFSFWHMQVALSGCQYKLHTFRWLQIQDCWNSCFESDSECKTKGRYQKTTFLFFFLILSIYKKFTR